MSFHSVPWFGHNLIWNRCPYRLGRFLLFKSSIKHSGQLFHVESTHCRARNTAKIQYKYPYYVISSDLFFFPWYCSELEEACNIKRISFITNMLKTHQLTALNRSVQWVVGQTLQGKQSREYCPELSPETFGECKFFHSLTFSSHRGSIQECSGIQMQLWETYLGFSNNNTSGTIERHTMSQSSSEGACP